MSDLLQLHHGIYDDLLADSDVQWLLGSSRSSAACTVQEHVRRELTDTEWQLKDTAQNSLAALRLMLQFAREITARMGLLNDHHLTCALQRTPEASFHFVRPFDTEVTPTSDQISRSYDAMRIGVSRAIGSVNALKVNGHWRSYLINLLLANFARAANSFNADIYHPSLDLIESRVHQLVNKK